MKKKNYLTPTIQIIEMGHDAVMATTSWYDGHGEWHEVIEGNPKDDEEGDAYAKFKFGCDWTNGCDWTE